MCNWPEPLYYQVLLNTWLSHAESTRGLALPGHAGRTACSCCRTCRLTIFAATNFRTGHRHRFVCWSYRSRQTGYFAVSLCSSRHCINADVPFRVTLIHVLEHGGAFLLVKLRCIRAGQADIERVFDGQLQL